MLHLDGSYGEGGGQILRTALSLAAVLGQPVTIAQIRAGRRKPGLRPQHLTAVLALARITGAEVAGAALNSDALTFRPRPPQPGPYLFDVAEKTGSAGSVTLLAQALLPPLLAASRPSRLVLRGGTHVAWSPPAHYLRQVFLPALAQLGGQASLTLNRWGWYPRGGGEVELEVQPAPAWSPAEWVVPPDYREFRAISGASRLPEHVRRRQGERLKARLGRDLPVDLIEGGGLDVGSMVLLYGPRAGFDALGTKGKPAENVADEAADAYLAFKERRATVDRHLADQIVLYLALARGESRFITPEITLHLLTNLWVIEQFLGPIFEVKGELGGRGKIICRGPGVG